MNSSKIHSENDSNRGETDTNNKHVRSLSWLGTGTLINKQIAGLCYVS